MHGFIQTLVRPSHMYKYLQIWNNLEHIIVFKQTLVNVDKEGTKS
jgi:hypothetical protein